MTIILAPHLECPTRNGGDIYVDRLACYLSARRGRVQLLGSNMLVSYENGIQADQEQFANRHRTKSFAALRTVALQSHYLLEKFLTEQYRQAALQLVVRHPDSLLIYSLISSASLGLSSRPAVILTQNDEVAWYRNQRRVSDNPFHKLVAHFSVRWLVHFLKQRAHNFVFAHITEADRYGYECLIPGQSHIVVPAGVEISSPNRSSSWDGKLRLLFCGSLSVQMNYDALAHFAERFWPVLRDSLNDNLEVWIAGSRPAAPVRKLCARNEWKLHADLPDAALQDLYAQATFGILPFPYTHGAKLKLLNCLAAGLPVLGTENMKYLPEQDFPPNLYSDDPNDWAEHLKSKAQSGIQPNEHDDCQQFAARYSWQTVALDMDHAIRKLGL